VSPVFGEVTSSQEVISIVL